jgi:hypothetical protein
MTFVTTTFFTRNCFNPKVHANVLYHDSGCFHIRLARVVLSSLFLYLNSFKFRAEDILKCEC